MGVGGTGALYRRVDPRGRRIKSMASDPSANTSPWGARPPKGGGVERDSSPDCQNTTAGPRETATESWPFPQDTVPPDRPHVHFQDGALTRECGKGPSRRPGVAVPLKAPAQDPTRPSDSGASLYACSRFTTSRLQGSWGVGRACHQNRDKTQVSCVSGLHGHLRRVGPPVREGSWLGTVRLTQKQCMVRGQRSLCAEAPQAGGGPSTRSDVQEAALRMENGAGAASR